MVNTKLVENHTKCLSVLVFKFGTELLKKLVMVKKGLTRADLVKNKWGRIVSRKKHVRGKKSGLKRLHAKGWFVSKGKFGATQRKGRKSRKATGKSRKKTRRCRHKSGPKKG